MLSIISLHFADYSREVKVTGAENTLKSILYGLLAIIIMIIVAVIFFVIVLYVIKFAADFVFGDNALEANWAVLSAVLLTAATLIGGVYSSYDE